MFHALFQLNVLNMANLIWDKKIKFEMSYLWISIQLTNETWVPRLCWLQQMIWNSLPLKTLTNWQSHSYTISLVIPALLYILQPSQLHIKILLTVFYISLGQWSVFLFRINYISFWNWQTHIYCLIKLISEFN